MLPNHAPPVENFLAQLHPQERAAIDDFLAAGVIGSPETVRQGLSALAQATDADEFILVCDVYDPALRLRSLDIAAAVCTDGCPAQLSDVMKATS